MEPLLTNSPSTEDTCHVHMAMAIPGFPSDQLDLLLPLSALCCTNLGEESPASPQQTEKFPL